jgi:hypothetical protein
VEAQPVAEAVKPEQPEASEEQKVAPAEEEEKKEDAAVHGKQDQIPGEEKQVSPPQEPEASSASPLDPFELNKKVAEAEAECASLLQAIRRTESNEELHELLREQQKCSYTSILTDMLAKESGWPARSRGSMESLAQALVERQATQAASTGAEALKLL